MINLNPNPFSLGYLPFKEGTFVMNDSRGGTNPFSGAA